MKREDLKKIIKLRSVWKINRKKGNYELPNGKKLSDYITRLVETQMEIDNLGIKSDGDLCFCSGGGWNEEMGKFNDYILMPDYEENETCTYEEMEKRIKKLVYEIIE